ncbi:MAG: EAL domain-containing response regulator [Gammaproteobacteria bacterium]
MSANRVLIMDDDPRVCRLFKRVAEGLAFEAFAIDNSSQFESAYVGFEPDIILLDLQMPGLDGVELIRYLVGQRTRAAVILVSGVDKSVIETTSRLGKSLGLNIVGSLIKPINVDDIKTLLREQFRETDVEQQEASPITKTDLARGIARNEILVCYQAKVDLATSQIVGVKALARWSHPRGELIFPNAFIPLAEETGLIRPLTYKILDIAVQDVLMWQTRVPGLTVAVKLSAKMLNDLDLPDRVAKILDAYQFDPQRLVLEISESGAMDSPASTMDILARLGLKGIQLCIGDFGTGYSSLVQLYRLPFRELKVDKSFVMEAGKSDEAATIVRSTIELARSLNLKVVAEGVEDQSTYEWLAGLGCQECQGYYISRPLEVPSFLSWLEEHNRAHRMPQ